MYVIFWGAFNFENVCPSIFRHRASPLQHLYYQCFQLNLSLCKAICFIALYKAIPTPKSVNFRKFRKSILYPLFIKHLSHNLCNANFFFLNQLSNHPRNLQMCFRIPTDVVLKASYSFIRVHISCGSLKSYVQRIYRK